jgi:hypothetical protein
MWLWVSQKKPHCDTNKTSLTKIRYLKLKKDG